MVIEILYPELSNIYGESANYTYFKQSYPAAELIETHLGERPKFFDTGAVDLVYRGTMTEKAQLIFIDNTKIYKEEIRSAIERGQHFLITGNALEVFGNKIIDKNQEETTCLGLFNFHTNRNLESKRFNSLYLGKYGEIDIVGFKSQFTESYYDEDISPMFKTVRGIGLNPDTKNEGIHYKNFMATYLIGPLLVLNPDLLITIGEELGAKGIRPVHEAVCREAFQKRLTEYRDENRGFYY